MDADGTSMIYGPKDKVAILECPQSGITKIVAKA